MFSLIIAGAAAWSLGGLFLASVVGRAVRRRDLMVPPGS